MSEPAGEFPVKGNSGSGTSYGYTVQARYMNNGGSDLINGVALGPKWITLSFAESPIGVPAGAVSPLVKDRVLGLLSYPAAQALRWWFIANAGGEYGLGSLCVETRILKHEHQYEYKTAAVLADEPIEGTGERQANQRAKSIAVPPAHPAVVAGGG